ncbi:MAG: hypothetical protein ACJ795_15400, partial [Ktedonobacteraceae bacterium]
MIHSVFRAAANILFAQDFVLSLNAATSPRMPNGLQLSPAAEGWPFSVLRVGMPVLFGAQRLHIEAIHFSLDLTNCSPWDPHIERPPELNMRIVVNNIRCLQRYLSHLYPQAVIQGGGKPPFRKRFFGENAPRPRRGGGGEGKGGDPCGRPSS